jgi:hypothetical protein
MLSVVVIKALRVNECCRDTSCVFVAFSTYILYIVHSGALSKFLQHRMFRENATLWPYKGTIVKATSQGWWKSWRKAGAFVSFSLSFYLRWRSWQIVLCFYVKLPYLLVVCEFCKSYSVLANETLILAYESVDWWAKNSGKVLQYTASIVFVWFDEFACCNKLLRLVHLIIITGIWSIQITSLNGFIYNREFRFFRQMPTSLR